MKRHVLLIIALLCFCVGSMAQGERRKFSPEEFRAHLEEYITQHAGFNANEAQQFYPLYHEMKDKQRKLQHEIFNCKKCCPADVASDKECAEKIAKIHSLNIQMAQLGEAYYKKMCKVVSAKKVYAAMLAEDGFHRQMLNNFNHNRPPKRRK